jgi:hypothetical protein
MGPENSWTSLIPSPQELEGGKRAAGLEWGLGVGFGNGELRMQVRGSCLPVGNSHQLPHQQG